MKTTMVACKTEACPVLYGNTVPLIVGCVDRKEEKDFLRISRSGTRASDILTGARYCERHREKSCPVKYQQHSSNLISFSVRFT